MARPYLKLQLTGLNGASGPVFGLLDTGADSTSLPSGYARLMGYKAHDLQAGKVGLANGAEVPVFFAKRPAEAFVAGLPEIKFELWPTFVDGSANVLWGRKDVFQAFNVGFSESSASFTLTTI